MEERIHFFERYLNCKKLQQLAEYQCPSVMKVHPYKKSWKSGFSLILRLLRGRDYSSSKHISRVLNPTQVYTIIFMNILSYTWFYWLCDV